MSLEDDRLADLVNGEPIVFMDCTQSELMGASLLSFAVGLTTGIFLGVLIGKIMIGVIFGLILCVLMTWAALNWMRNARQKYYITWFKEKMYLLKSRRLAPLKVWQWFSPKPENESLLDESRRFRKGGRHG